MQKGRNRGRKEGREEGRKRSRNKSGGGQHNAPVLSDGKGCETIADARGLRERLGPSECWRVTGWNCGIA